MFPVTGKDLFIEVCFQYLGVRPVPEYRFCPSRKWRADYCFVDQKLIIEIEGGAFTKGRHTRGKGYINDMEKYNAMTVLGYRLLRYTPQQKLKTSTIEQIKQVLNT